MAVCVDASLPLAFLLADEQAASAADRWARWLKERETIVSPPLFWPEITSAIRLRAYLKKMSDREAETALDRALAWPVTIWPDEPGSAGLGLQRQAYRFAGRFNRPRAYDAQYLAVAAEIGCDLWTADRRLHNAVRNHLPWVRWIGDYEG